MSRKAAVRRRVQWMPMVFAGPALVVILLLVAFPIIYNIYMSFFTQTWSGELEFAGMANFVELFFDDFFRGSLLHTLWWAVIGVLGVLFLSTWASILLTDKDINATLRKMCTVLIALPYLIPAVVSAAVWKWIYHYDFGPLNDFLIRFGLFHRVAWLEQPTVALWAIAALWIWHIYPVLMLQVLAALQAIPFEIREAASIDGASKSAVIRHILVPMIKPNLIILGLLATLWASKSFAYIQVMTEGGPANSTAIFSHYIYNAAFIKFAPGLTAAASIVMFLVMLGISSFYISALRRSTDAD